VKIQNLTYKILSGKHRVSVEGNTYYLTLNFTPEERLLINEACDKVRDTCLLMDVINEEEMLRITIQNNIWSEENNKLIKQIPKEIEDLKVDLFKAYTRTKLRENIRKQIKARKDRLTLLLQKKLNLLEDTEIGITNFTEMMYIIYFGLKDESMNKVWVNEEDFLQYPSTFLNRVVEEYSRDSLSEETIRTIARNEPWRSIWSASKKEGRLFGIPSVFYSDSQRALVLWSTLYDNIHESPDCPPQDIIDDDDMLDGWMINQGREREADRQKNEIESKLSKNPRLANSDEVYVMVDTMEDAQKIGRMNDKIANITKIRKMQYIKQKGVVRDQDLPDAKLRKMQQAAQQR